MNFFAYKKSGFWSFTIGLCVLLMLIAGNIIWAVKGDNLYQRGDRFLPPFQPLFQALLFEPPEPIISVEKADAMGSLFGGFETDEDNVEEAAETIFKNMPKKTAIAGRQYIFRPEFEEIKPELRIRNAPEGFRIEDDEFRWVPSSEQAGRFDITVEAITDDGTVHTLTYQLLAAERNYLMGTDNQGRSVAGLMIEGTYWATIPGLVAVFVAVFIGVLFGAFSGYYPGRISDTIDYLVNVLESMPALLLFFLAAVIFHFNIYWVMIAVGLAFAPGYVKSIRNLVREFVQNQFVEASKELGFSNMTVLWRDIVWVNGKAQIIARACYCFAFAILAEVTLSYLNFGVQISDGVSWGTLLLQGKDNVGSYHTYWLVFFPGVAITTSIVGIYLLGDGLGKLLDYKSDE